MQINWNTSLTLFWNVLSLISFDISLFADAESSNPFPDYVSRRGVQNRYKRREDFSSQMKQNSVVAKLEVWQDVFNQQAWHSSRHRRHPSLSTRDTHAWWPCGKPDPPGIPACLRCNPQGLWTWRRPIDWNRRWCLCRCQASDHPLRRTRRPRWHWHGTAFYTLAALAGISPRM